MIYSPLNPIIMFTHKLLISAFLSLVLGSLSIVSAQQMEMHASDPEAIQLVDEALQNMGHDMVLFGANVEKAAKLDPAMVVANFFVAMDPDRDKEAARPYIERIQVYEGKTSAGEDILIEMTAHFDEDDYDFLAEVAQLAEVYPADARIHLLIGTVYMYGQKPALAIPYLKKASELDQLPGAYNMLGYAYMGLGKLDEAQASFEAYGAAAPNHYNPFDSMGDYYMAIEDYAAAAESFDKAAELNPDFPGHAEKAAKAREKMKK